MNFLTITRVGAKVSAIAICAALAGTGGYDSAGGFFSAASAQTTGGQGTGQGNEGGQGQGSQGSQAGQGNQGGQGSGQGGPDETSEGVGPQAGGPSTAGSGGGKPAWAQEGIPEVELGRLSVARSPDQVLQRSLDEAVATWTSSMEDFYNLSLDDMIDQLSLNWDNLTIYDSPLQNLALFKDLLADGVSQLPVTNTNETLLAVFLGVASDKTVQISEDTVIAMLTILGDGLENPISVDVTQLALDAEAIRIAVLAGHG